MAKVIALLKTEDDFINSYKDDDEFNFDITLYDLSKRNGLIKGIADYGYVKGFGIVRIPFRYAYNGQDDYFEDWSYEDGKHIPYEIYIWETIRMLDERKLINK